LDLLTEMDSLRSAPDPSSAVHDDAIVSIVRLLLKREWARIEAERG